MGRLQNLAGVLACILALTTSTQPAQAEAAITVFAAASLSEAMTAAGDAYRNETHRVVRFSFAASSTLSRQIEAGAPAQVFASANESWMDYLENLGLIVPESRVSAISNRLVLIAPRSAGFGPLALDRTLDLAALLGRDGRLAVGDPAHVPAGIYAQQSLESLGLWSAVEHRLARADNVRAALALVASGEASLGITYATDARIASGVRILGSFPAASHAPITYPFAILAEQDSADARDFLAFLTSEKGLSLFQSFGFARAE